MKVLTVLCYACTLLLYASSSLAEEFFCPVSETQCDQVLMPHGEALEIKNQNLAGQTICLPAGTYKWLYIDNVQGEPDNPVTLKNCGGKVIIDGNNQTGSGIGVLRSKHIRISGDGDDINKYGIRLKRSGVYGINADQGTSDIEIHNIEITDGYSGISVRTYPHCDGQFSRGTWALENVILHNNYIHDVNGEGLYIGTSHYHQDPTPLCPNSVFLEAEIRNIHIHNNRIEDVGRDGIQVGAGVSGVEVHHNSIKRYALHQHYGHGGGLQINPGTVGKFNNNWIESFVGDQSGSGIQYAGGDTGDLDIFNNVIIGAPTAFSSLGRMANPNYSIRLVNNTVVNSGNVFYMFCNENQIENFVIKNNLFAGYEGVGYYYWENWQKIIGNQHYFNCLINGQSYGPTNDPSHYEFSENSFFEQAELAHFKNIDSNDFRLLPDSPAINSGDDYTWLVDYDYENSPRSNSSLDNGAYVFIHPQNNSPFKIDFIGTTIQSDWQCYPASYHNNAVTLLDSEDGMNQLGIAISANFCGQSDTEYVTEPNAPQVMPKGVLKSFWYTCENQVAELTLSGLLPDQAYDVSLIASRVAQIQKTTQFTLNGQTKYLNVTNNDANLVVFENVTSNTGSLTLQVSRFDDGVGNQYGYINGMIITPKP